jgi:hypothetical protein
MTLKAIPQTLLMDWSEPKLPQDRRKLSLTLMRWGEVKQISFLHRPLNICFLELFL